MDGVGTESRDASAIDAKRSRRELRFEIASAQAMISDAAAHTAGGDSRPVLYSSATPDDAADPRATQPAPAASTSSSGYDSLTTVLATKGLIQAK